MIRRVAIALGLVTAMAALLPAPARAADGFPLRSVGRPAFLLDLRELAADEDSVEVEISWQVALRELSFRPEDDVYRARYEIAVIFTRDGRQEAGELWERRVRVRTLDETRDATELSRGRHTVRLPAGRFDVRTTLTDRVSGASTQAASRYEARVDRSGIGLSDLRLVRYTGDGVERNAAHDIPLGESGHAVRVTIRCAAGAEGSVQLRWKFDEPGGRQVAGGDSTVTLDGSTQKVVDLRIDSGALLPGRHHVEVRLGASDRRDRREVEVNARATRAWMASHRAEALEILALSADEDEVRALRAAEGDTFAGALDAFWKRHDPSPGATDNGYVGEILGRVDAVCTLFVEPFRYPAWRTDRGRIWMQYGRPARRSESPGDFDHPSTEIWEYDVPRHVFVFVDRGSGEYWLSG